MSPIRTILALLFVVLSITTMAPNTHISHHASPAASPFRLPIASGLSVDVYQGNNDTQHDHVGKARWAFDFTVGYTNFAVTAAQSGTVIGANYSSSTGCGDVGCWTQANYVLITDDDGTTAALYLHLKQFVPNTNMPEVTIGEHVSQGQPLGLADTTGWATGPHLHFQVENIPSVTVQQQKYPGWWWTQSVPVSFSNPEVLRKRANGIPMVDDKFDVSNPPQVISSPAVTQPPIATPATPLPVPTPTQPLTPTPSLIPTSPPSPTPTSTPTTTPPTPTPPAPVLVPTPTPQTPLLIMVQNVYTTDANQHGKTTFSPGDSINYHVDADNYQGTAVPVDVQFEVFAAGVGNYSYNETIHVNMPAGLSRFYTPKNIPTNASSGEYIVRITITQSNDQRNTDWGEGRFTIG